MSFDRERWRGEVVGQIDNQVRPLSNGEAIILEYSIAPWDRLKTIGAEEAAADIRRGLPLMRIASVGQASAQRYSPRAFSRIKYGSRENAQAWLAAVRRDIASCDGPAEVGRG